MTVGGLVREVVRKLPEWVKVVTTSGLSSRELKWSLR